MAEQTEVLPAPPTAPPGPSGLDAVLIDGCTFTESAGKLEPRPPLYVMCEGYPSTGEILGLTDGIFLSVTGGRVVVKASTTPPIAKLHRDRALGEFVPGAPCGPHYTGPITPSMWAIINKWWTP